MEQVRSPSRCGVRAGYLALEGPMKRQQKGSLESLRKILNLCVYLGRDLDSASYYADDVYFIKDRTCFNYGGSKSAYAPFLSPQVAQYVNTSAMEPINVPTDFAGTPSNMATAPTVSANSNAGGSYVAASG